MLFPTPSLLLLLLLLFVPGVPLACRLAPTAHHQDGLGVTNDIVEILDHNQDSSDANDRITMLFFNGLLDLICNHVGNEIALENLEWKYQKQYVKSTRYGWKSKMKNQLAGYVKQYSNLIFLKVKDSGHMVRAAVVVIFILQSAVLVLTDLLCSLYALFPFM